MLKKIFFFSLIVSTLNATDNSGNCYYLKAEAGVSFSRCADLCVDTSYWDQANEGYNNNLSKAPLVGFGFGYNISNLLSVGVSVNHRSKYKYCKNQTPPLGTESTTANLGSKTRFFNLDNTSFMVDIFFNKLACENPFAWQICDQLYFYPYIGFGFGLSKNTLYNFHSVRNFTETVGNLTINPIGSIMTYQTTNQFAWQFQLIFDFLICDFFKFDLGYRYFNGGNFKTNNYLVDVLSGFSTPISAVPWVGKLKANEFLVGFNIDF